VDHEFMLVNLLLLLAVASPVFWLAQPHRWRHNGWLAAIPPALVTAWLVGQTAAVAQGEVITAHYAWVESLGLSLDLRLDGLALLFGLIISGIGVAIAIYAGYYFEDDPRLGYFYGLLFLFMASMLGLVWADNLLVLYVFWEGTSITSYLLIAFKLSDQAALEGARRALIVTGLGALAMLAGMVLLAQIGGSYKISELLALSPASYLAHPLFPVMLVLILLGAFTKSAQFPFHFWLPGAMAAPTPASAYLHSATMVKAGVYLLARFHPAFSESPIWFWSLLVIGGITMLVGAVSALGLFDLKAVLAYATVSQLGILVMLLAFASKEAYVAVVVGILAHALYKGPLFLIAGVIDHATGTRDLRHLAGLGRLLPWVATTTVLAGVSMAALPPTFGFIGKEVLLENFVELTDHGAVLVGWVGLIAVALAGVCFVGYSLILIWEPFFRRRAPLEQAAMHHRPSFWFVLPALALTLLGALIPFWPGDVERTVLGPAASAIAGAPVEVHLSLWHGVTRAFVTSMGVIVLGLLLFWQREAVRALLRRQPAWLDATRWSDQVMDGLYVVARMLTRLVQERSLAMQVGLTMLCAVAFTLFALLTADFIGDLRTNWAALPAFYEVVLTILAMVAALVTVRTRSRLSAIISLGVVGVVVTLIFVFFGAPDLALTQLLIEVLTVVLLVLVFYRIPMHVPLRPPPVERVRNILIAGAVGFWGFLMVLLAAETPLVPSISDYFTENAIPAAHGANIVNVILVDFRGFDTMGEITVLAIAAVGGYGLLRASRLRPVRQQRTARPLDTPPSAEPAPATPHPAIHPMHQGERTDA
jgi:multicomponent Na+:H+ antiporter subunit A